MPRMVRISSIAFFMIAGATMAAGWISDRGIARGGSPTRVRKTMVVGGLSCSTVILPVAAGRWTSLQNGIGSLSGVVASWLTGFVVQHTQSFALAFAVAAAVALTGAFLWGAMVGGVKPVEWERGAAA